MADARAEEFRKALKPGLGTAEPRLEIAFMRSLVLEEAMDDQPLSRHRYNDRGLRAEIVGGR